MTLRPLRELQDLSNADEALAVQLARSFSQRPVGGIPAPRALDRRRARAFVLRPAIALLVLALAGVASARFLATHDVHLFTPAPQSTTPATHHRVQKREVVELPAPDAPQIQPEPKAAPSVITAPPNVVTTPPNVVTTPRSAAIPTKVVAERRVAEPIRVNERVELPARTPLVTAPVDDGPDSPLALRRPDAPPTPSQSAAPVVVPSLQSAPTSEDFDILVSAMRALRSEHDAPRAAALATRYLTAHPGGALVEDALAIRVEAAITAHDANASTLAREYLARFPSGRYATAVRRVTR